MAGPDAVVGRTYNNVRVRIDVSSPFTVPISLKVTERSGRTVKLEVAHAWYVSERELGSPVGAKYTFTFPGR